VLVVAQYANATITGLTITGGRLEETHDQNGNGEAALGGGIENIGTVTLDDDTITNSTATGGIATASGSAGGNAQGGGVMNMGTATIIDSTVSNNTVIAGAGNTADSGGQTTGGGIYSIGTLTIEDSTVGPGNIATASEYAGGGGIEARYGLIEIVNSTIFGNTAQQGTGGGLDSLEGGDISILPATRSTRTRRRRGAPGTSTRTTSRRSRSPTP
jgi:hypothetical protein